MNTQWIVAKRTNEAGRVVRLKMAPTKFDRMPGDEVVIDNLPYTVVTSPVDHASAKDILTFQCKRFGLTVKFN